MADPESSVRLSELLRVAAVERRTFSLTVKSGAREGKIRVSAGDVVHAVFGQWVGEDALRAMVNAPNLKFRMPLEANESARSSRRTPPPLPPEDFEAGDDDPARSVAPATTARGRPRVPSLLPSPAASARPTQPRRPALPSVELKVAMVMALAAVAGILFGVAFNLVLAHRQRPDQAAVPSAPEVSPISAPVAGAWAGAIDAADLAASDERPKLVHGVVLRRPNVDLALSPTVILRVLIATSGEVVDARIYRSRVDLEAFEVAALESAKKLRFSPARRSGVAVPVWMNWPVHFQLQSERTETLRVKGSDTIGAALGPALGEAFGSNTGVHVTFEALGSASAFVGLFDGTAAIGASSRAVNETELAKARALGITLEEFVFGYDGIAIIVHPSNPIGALTLEQASALFAGRFSNWSELGHAGGGKILRIGRSARSGTHAFFKEKLLRKGNQAGPEEFAADTRFVERSEDVVELVRTDPSSLGYVGLGFVKQTVKVLALALGERDRPVLPSEQSVRDGSYPIYRPLLFYTRGSPGGSVREFLRFALSPEGQALVARHHFVGGDFDGQDLPSAAKR